MRRGLAALIAPVFASAITSPLLAQSLPEGTAPGAWVTGSQPVPGLMSARRTPNVQPVAPSQPAGGQPRSSVVAPETTSAPGVAWGGGTFYAGGTVGAFYDDNVFASNANPRGDTAFVARPEVSWLVQAQNFTFAADGNIEGRKYRQFDSEDQVNGTLGMAYKVMPDADTQVVGSTRYIHAHLARGSSDTVVALPGGASAILDTQFARPVAYDQGIQTLALNKRYGNWWSSIGGAGLAVQYQNPTIGGAAPFAGTIVDLTYANGGIAAVNGRVGYVVAPRTSVFAEVVGNIRNWGVDYFDSNGYRVVGGLLLEDGPDARVKGELWAGFMSQNYNGVTMQGVSSWTYGLSGALAITDQLTGVVSGRREAKEAALSLALLPTGAIGASNITCSTLGGAVCVSAIETEVGARLDYRVLPNVVVGAGVTYLELEYQGDLAFGRVDRTFSPLASIKYFPARNLTLAFDYRNVGFGSSGGMAPPPFTNVSALSYNKNVYLLSANAKW